MEVNLLFTYKSLSAWIIHRWSWVRDLKNETLPTAKKGAQYYKWRYKIMKLHSRGSLPHIKFRDKCLFPALLPWSPMHGFLLILLYCEIWIYLFDFSISNAYFFQFIICMLLQDLYTYFYFRYRFIKKLVKKNYILYLANEHCIICIFSSSNFWDS